MSTMAQVRRRHIGMMERTCQILGNIVRSITQEQATALRDGPDGWTTLEVLCHLRDFDGFFYGRAVMMLEQERPQLPAYDHEALAVERGYNGEDLKQVYADLERSRHH